MLRMLAVGIRTETNLVKFGFAHFQLGRCQENLLWTCICINLIFNPLMIHVPILCPLKTPENLCKSLQTFSNDRKVNLVKW